MMGIKRLAAVLLPIALLALACGEAGGLQTQLAPEIQATVQAVVAETQTAGGRTISEPDIEATVNVRVQGTVRALLAATPIPSPTPTVGLATPTPQPTRFTLGIGGAFNTAPAPAATRIPSPTPFSTPQSTTAPIQLGPCAPAAEGTTITAWVNDALAASAQVLSGSYILLLEQPAGASFIGQTVAFKVGGSQAKQTVRWKQGGATELVLSAPGSGLSRFYPPRSPGSSGGPLAQPLPPHVILGTVFVGDC